QLGMGFRWIIWRLVRRARDRAHSRPPPRGGLRGRRGGPPFPPPRAPPPPPYPGGGGLRPLHHKPPAPPPQQGGGYRPLPPRVDVGLHLRGYSQLPGGGRSKDPAGRRDSR